MAEISRMANGQVTCRVSGEEDPRGDVTDMALLDGMARQTRYIRIWICGAFRRIDDKAPLSFDIQSSKHERGIADANLGKSQLEGSRGHFIYP
jgi:hypothetical protein